MDDPTPIELVNFDLSVKIREDLDANTADDPSASVLHLPFEVHQGALLVARGDAVRLLVSEAIHERISIAELFDCVDQDVHELYAALFDPTTERLREDVAEPGAGVDVLYVQSLKIVPERRGRQLALRIVQRLRQYFASGCAVLALKAHPLRHDAEYGDAFDARVFSRPFPATGDAAKAKLRAYWSQLGFRRVDETDFMVFDMTDEPPPLIAARASS